MRLPPRTPRTDTLFPNATLFRSRARVVDAGVRAPHRAPPDDDRADDQGVGQRDPGQPGLLQQPERLLHAPPAQPRALGRDRSEEHTSEPQSLMRNSYPVVRLKQIIMNDHILTHTSQFQISI